MSEITAKRLADPNFGWLKIRVLSSLLAKFKTSFLTFKYRKKLPLNRQKKNGSFIEKIFLYLKKKIYCQH